MHLILLLFILLITGRTERVEAQQQVLQIDIKDPIYAGNDAFLTLHFRDNLRAPTAPISLAFQVNDERSKRVLLPKVSIQSGITADYKIKIPKSANILIQKDLPDYREEYHTLTIGFKYSCDGGIDICDGEGKASFPVRNIRFPVAAPTLIFTATLTPTATPMDTATPVDTATPTATAVPTATNTP